VETVLLFIFGVVIFIIGLVLSVALHELGHLSFAKLFGVRVSQYMVGFGRTLWSVKRGETEYGIKAILAGGYISMAGMFAPAREGKSENTVSRNIFRTLVQDARQASATTMADTDESRAFYKASPWKRIIIMLAGPFMNLLIGIGIAAILVCGFGAPTATVGSIASCVPVAASGDGACAAGDPTSPAKVAGLKTGDVLVKVAGVDFPGVNKATQLFQQSADKSIPVTVKRGDKTISLSVTPTPVKRQELDSNGTVVTDASGKPHVATLGAIGIGVGQALVPQPATAILPSVGNQVGSTFELMGRLPSSLVGVWNSVFTSAPRSQNSPVSVVGVGRAIGEISSLSGVPILDKTYAILGLLGSLNIALFVLNLLPLLPLDGGHVVGALWEMIRGAFAKLFRRRNPGPVDMARAMPVTFVVVTVLIAVSALLIVADIVKPVSVTG
jgi:membrane-associated protease RseP (regulator of RpoE activity)